MASNSGSGSKGSSALGNQKTKPSSTMNAQKSIAGVVGAQSKRVTSASQNGKKRNGKGKTSNGSNGGEADFVPHVPSAGFSLAPEVQLPKGGEVARSLDGTKAQCLLCGRISSWNEWRIRAHYAGGDPHVQLCPGMSSESRNLQSNRRTDSKEPTVSEETVPDLQDKWNFKPVAGFRPAKPTVKSPWLKHLAFNLEGRAQCLLCGRISTRNMARLRAHYYGGDKHVALCPSRNGIPEEGAEALQEVSSVDSASTIEEEVVVKRSSKKLNTSRGGLSTTLKVSEPGVVPKKAKLGTEPEVLPTEVVAVPAITTAVVDAAVDAFAFSSMGSATLVTSKEFQTLIRALSGIRDWTYD